MKKFFDFIADNIFEVAIAVLGIAIVGIVILPVGILVARTLWSWALSPTLIF